MTQTPQAAAYDRRRRTRPCSECGERTWARIEEGICMECRGRRMLDRYEEIGTLWREGRSDEEIGAQVGVSAKSVRKLAYNAAHGFGVEIPRRRH
jgi:hypothetical protein